MMGRRKIRRIFAQILAGILAVCSLPAGSVTSAAESGAAEEGAGAYEYYEESVLFRRQEKLSSSEAEQAGRPVGSPVMKTDVQDLHFMVKKGDTYGKDNAYVSAEDMAAALNWNLDITPDRATLMDDRMVKVGPKTVSYTNKVIIFPTSSNSMYLSTAVFGSQYYIMPEMCVYDDSGKDGYAEDVWIPFSYLCTLANAKASVAENQIYVEGLGDNCIDVLNEVYACGAALSFDFVKDFGFSKTEMKNYYLLYDAIGRTNGLMSGDWRAWTSMSAYWTGKDSFQDQFGKNLATLLTTSSKDEMGNILGYVDLLMNTMDYHDVFTDVDKLEDLKDAGYEIEIIREKWKRYPVMLQRVNEASRNSSRLLMKEGINSAEVLLQLGAAAYTFKSKDESSLDALMKYLQLEEQTDGEKQEGSVQETTRNLRDSMLTEASGLNTNAGLYSVYKLLDQNGDIYPELVSFLTTMAVRIREAAVTEGGVGTSVTSFSDLVPELSAAGLYWDFFEIIDGFGMRNIERANAFEQAIFACAFQNEVYEDLDAQMNVLRHTGQMDSGGYVEGVPSPERLHYTCQLAYLFLKTAAIARDEACSSMDMGELEQWFLENMELEKELTNAWVPKGWESWAADKMKKRTKIGENRDLEAAKEIAQAYVDSIRSLDDVINPMLAVLDFSTDANDNAEYGMLPQDNVDYVRNYDDQDIVDYLRRGIVNNGGEVVSDGQYVYYWQYTADAFQLDAVDYNMQSIESPNTKLMRVKKTDGAESAEGTENAEESETAAPEEIAAGGYGKLVLTDNGRLWYETGTPYTSYSTVVCRRLDTGEETQYDGMLQGCTDDDACAIIFSYNDYTFRFTDGDRVDVSAALPEGTWSAAYAGSFSGRQYIVSPEEGNVRIDAVDLKNDDTERVTAFPCDITSELYAYPTFGVTAQIAGSRMIIQACTVEGSGLFYGDGELFSYDLDKNQMTILAAPGEANAPVSDVFSLLAGQGGVSDIYYRGNVDLENGGPSAIFDTNVPWTDGWGCVVPEDGSARPARTEGVLVDDNGYYWDGSDLYYRAKGQKELQKAVSGKALQEQGFSTLYPGTSEVESLEMITSFDILGPEIYFTVTKFTKDLTTSYGWHVLHTHFSSVYRTKAGSDSLQLLYTY